MMSIGEVDFIDYYQVCVARGLDINNASLLLLNYDLNPSTRPLCNFRIK